MSQSTVFLNFLEPCLHSFFFTNVETVKLEGRRSANRAQ